MSIHETLPDAPEGRMVWRGEVAVIADESAHPCPPNTVWAKIHAFDEAQLFGPCRMLSGGIDPQVGDACLIAFDNEHEPWVVALWHPTSPGVILPSRIQPGANGQYLKTVAGVSSWADLQVGLADLDFDPATQAELNAHTALTVGAHGGIVADTDARLTNQRVPTDGSVTNAKVAVGAAITRAKLDFGSGLVNGDIAAAAGILRSKLDLGSGLVNGDIAAAAALAISKLAGFPNDVSKVLAGDGTWPKGVSVLYSNLLGANGGIDTGANGVPQTHSHLLLIASVRTTNLAAAENIGPRINADVGLNYNFEYITGNAAVAPTSAEALAQPNAGVWTACGAGAPAGCFGINFLLMMDYKSVLKHKQFVGLTYNRRSAASGGMYVQLIGGDYAPATIAAITRVQLLSSATFLKDSWLAILGIG